MFVMPAFCDPGGCEERDDYIIDRLNGVANLGKGEVRCEKYIGRLQILNNVRRQRCTYASTSDNCRIRPHSVKSATAAKFLQTVWKNSVGWIPERRPERGRIVAMAHITASRPIADPAVPGSDGRLCRPPTTRCGFIDAFVDRLDLAAAGFIGVVPKAMGRPGYAAADLLKLYIYGYLNRLRSSRAAGGRGTHRNVEVIWLLRQLKPDFKTIADFRRDNRAAFKPVFREFVLLCRQLDLFGRELLAVDGTRIKAVNNKDRNFTARLTGHVHQAGRRQARRLPEAP